jgi:GAF domain-containing protein
MVTRTSGDDWIVLSAIDHGYGVGAGDVFRWSDSFCSRMVAGHGPRLAPRSADVPAYVEAPIGQRVRIGAYVGVPLHTAGDELFGTLCAIDPEAQPDSIMQEQHLIELLAGLLSNILVREQREDEALRRAERAEHESLLDPLTGSRTAAPGIAS